MPINPTRARARELLRDAAEIVKPLDVPPIAQNGPGPAIGEIIFELVRAGMAWAAQRPIVCRRRLTRAYNALAILRVQLQQQAETDKLPSLRRK